MDGIAGVKERGERERERGLDGGVFIDRICVYIFEKIFCVALSIFFFFVNAIDTESEKNRRKSIKIIYHSFFLLFFFFVFSSGAHRRRAT